MSKIEEMIEKAQEVRKKAHAPYSQFDVGVCLRTDDDQLIVGCNIENASYGLTMCAEATAIGGMVTSGGKQIVEMVVTPCPPCGACRQMLREFASPNVPVHIVDNDGRMETLTLNDLLPNSFGPESLF